MSEIEAPFLGNSSERAPTVSVGIPVYNGENYLAEAIESILAQNFGDFELIISDNASTDGTREICHRYENLDSRVTYMRNKQNLGAAKNYNHVFRAASGTYFKWAAHDDLLKPEFLSCCIAGFEEFETPPALVYPRSEFIDESGEVLGADPKSMHAVSPHTPIRVFRFVQAMGLVTSVFGLFHRDTLARTRLIGSFIASDYVLLLECAILGKIVHLDSEPLFQRRIHINMSRQANLTDKDVLHWFDPAAKSKLSSKQRLYLEYLKSIYGIDGLNSIDRQLCAVSLLSSLTLRTTRVVLGRWRRQLF